MNRARRPLAATQLPGSTYLIRLLALATIALVVACGGDGNDDAGVTAPGAPVGPEATVRGTGSQGPTDPAGATGSTGSRSGLVNSSLNSLASYRYEVTMEGTGSIAESLGLEEIAGLEGNGAFKYTISGARIAPDQAQLELDFAGRSLKQTVKGNQQWITFAGVSQGPIAADSSAEDLTLAASLIDHGTLEAARAEFACDTIEEVHGVRARRCQGDLEDFKRAQEDLGGIFADTTVREVTAFSSDFWIAEEGGYAVKADTRMSGKTTDGKDFSLALTLNVTDIGRVTEITP